MPFGRLTIEFRAPGSAHVLRHVGVPYGMLGVTTRAIAIYCLRSDVSDFLDLFSKVSCVRRFSLC